MSDNFLVEQDKGTDTIGNYTYRIYRRGLLIAKYWHDSKGDEHEIEFLNGKVESCPVGKMTDFLIGGGIEPLSLSKLAKIYLAKNDV